MFDAVHWMCYRNLVKKYVRNFRLDWYFALNYSIRIDYRCKWHATQPTTS